MIRLETFIDVSGDQEIGHWRDDVLSEMMRCLENLMALS